MRIVIDLQAAQSPGSRHRGIGRYSIALARAMLRHRGDHEILLALNGMFEDTITPLRETFGDLIAAQDIHVWHATMPAYPAAGAPSEQRHAAELVREAFLARLKPDMVHVASIFESNRYSVTSVHKGPHAVPTAVTLYDLIPHIYPDHYQVTPQAAREYEEKIAHLRRADLWLAISESSRQEGLALLGLPADQVVNISSAADDHFTPGSVAPERELALRQRYGLLRPFVMYTGGIDHRKNVDGLVRAWSALPAEVRGAHQLAIVCAVQQRDRDRLEHSMLGCGLAAGDAVLTGFVSEEDLVDLYRLCKLFVFPSQHEGFGLPALEAMRCGAAVIGSDNSSIPEVIGRADAMFDARSDGSITAKIMQCLQDDQFRAGLARHGPEQAQRFSWDNSAKAALAAIERTVAATRPASPAPSPRRPRLAFVTPMPPQRSGIADSSAELLPHLAAHYDIDLVLDQPEFHAPESAPLCPVRTAQWFLEHGHEYDRVLYQFGNSSYHAYMFPLMERHPGALILHDFFVSGVIAHRELHGGGPHWSQALYRSHGWHAIAQRFHTPKPADVIYAYPANFELFGEAQGVIVHSEYALRLARQWYQPGVTDDWALVPLLRTPAPAASRAAARGRLGLGQDDFIVCSFGLLGPIKANHRLLRAWRGSVLAAAPACQLLFVGEPQRSAYGKAFETELALHSGNVRITGWTDGSAYDDYLDAADMAVQLRSNSRGETSAAVLDCLNHGLPTIANRAGSMADLDEGAVWLLPEEFTDKELAGAMEALWRDPVRRAAMQARGREIVHALHAPAACAAAYRDAIEAFARSATTGTRVLVDELAKVLPADTDDDLLAALSRAIAQNMPPPRPARQLLIDIGESPVAPGLAPAALSPLMRGLIEKPRAGWRAEPVYRGASGDWLYARKYALGQLDCPDHVLHDDPLDLQPGDVWSMLHDAADSPARPASQRAIELGLPALRLPPQGDGALVWAALAATSGSRRERQWFIDISELVRRDWLSGIQRVVKNYLLELLRFPPADTLVVPVYATSDQPGYRVAQDYVLKLAGLQCEQHPHARIEPRPGDLFFGLDLQPLVIPAQAAFLEELRQRGVGVAFMVYDLLPLQLPDYFGPGAADNHARWLETATKTADVLICISQAVADDLAGWINRRPDAVRTAPRIEAVHLGADLAHSVPTRGVALDAASQLDQIRRRPSFLMVGTLEPRKCHAKVLAAFERLWAAGEDVALVVSGRPGWMVDALAASLSSHPERDNRLFWLDDSSDEYLEQVYAASTCLIAASLGEGFGLPLVEAAQHGLPIIARDLPVFREVAGEHAFYFKDDTPDALSAALMQWLGLFHERRHPLSKGMPWLTWRQSAAQIRQILLQHDGRSATAP